MIFQQRENIENVNNVTMEESTVQFTAFSFKEPAVGCKEINKVNRIASKHTHKHTCGKKQDSQEEINWIFIRGINVKSEGLSLSQKKIQNWANFITVPT